MAAMRILGSRELAQGHKDQSIVQGAGISQNLFSAYGVSPLWELWYSTRSQPASNSIISNAARVSIIDVDHKRCGIESC